MEIRRATINDLDAIMPIFDEARGFMRRNGNLGQWTGGYPSREQIADDIALGHLYKAVDGDAILGVFFFAVMDEPTYHVIDGSWTYDRPYGVIHRIARGPSFPGSLLHEALAFASEVIDYIRVDTYCDNIPMQRALEREGFTRCGIIWIADGSERIAFDRLRV